MMKSRKYKIYMRKCIFVLFCVAISNKRVWSGVIANPSERTNVLNITSITTTPKSVEKSSSESSVLQKDVEHAALSAVKEETPSDKIEDNIDIIQKNNKTVSTQASFTNTTESTLEINEESKNETSEKPEEPDFLPEEGAAEKEHSSSLAIFFVLFVIILCVFFVHGILKYNCHHIPESLAIVFLGAVVGLIMKMLPSEDIKQVESFSPTMFFLVLLPPIIFESGYNLHKGMLHVTLLLLDYNYRLTRIYKSYN